MTLLVLTAGQQYGQSFTNVSGEPVKELQRDTRFASAQLSREGKDLAGDDPYIIWNDRLRELVISTPKQLQDFLSRDAQDHYKPKNMNLGHYAGRLLGQCVAQQRGQKWKTMRSHFDPEFSYQSSRNIIPIFSESINRWLNALPEANLAVRQKPSEFAQNATKECKRLAFRLIALSLYGDLFTETVRQETHVEVVQSTSNNRKALDGQFSEKLGKFQHFSPRVKLTTSQQGIRCPAEHIFRGVEKGAMTQTEVREAAYVIPGPPTDFGVWQFLQTLDEILFTNIDITGSVLASIFINLALNVFFQETLRAELKARKSQASYTVADYIAQQDSLLHCVTLESLRISPALAFSPAECTSVEKIIGGCIIPAGTPTVIDIRRLNTHPSVWGSDAEVFRPERFLNMTPAQYRYAMLRFGIGPGKCMGKNMADVLLKMTVIAVVERYIIGPFQGQKGEEKGPAKPSNGEILFTPV
ncbi:MAG: hypothetical protein Q9214_001576 [Letrouitia sp. 1 TL-2023]